MSSEIRLGFVGAGYMGQCAHLRNYAAIEGCRVVALAEIRPGLRAQVAARYGIPNAYADHRAMLAAEPLDAIVAIQPYEHHRDLLPDLYASGLPLLTEKPLASCIETAQRLLATLAHSSTRHYVAYHKRSDPATVYAHARISELKASRELGALKYIRILMPAGDWIASGFTGLVDSGETAPALPCDTPPAEFDSPRREAHDVFVNYYIHQVNLMRHLMGEPYTVSYADPSRTLMVVHGESGVCGTIEMSPYQTTVDWQEEALVAFEKGYLRLRLPAPLACNRPGSVEIFADPGNGAIPQRIQPQLPWVHAMRRQAEYFLEAVRGNETPLCTAREAAEDLAIAYDYIRGL